MVQRIIALDVDGVVNSTQWFIKMKCDALDRRPLHNMIDPDCVARLNRLVEACQPKIVLSSSWRIVHGLSDTRAALRHHGFSGVINDQTPRYLQNRGAEIQAWLTANGHDAENLVILDDSSDMAHLMPCLVRTSMDVGLTDADVDRALAMFRVEPRPREVEVVTMEDVG